MSDHPPDHNSLYTDNAAFGRLLRTGLDDRKLRAIGAITIIWNSVEIDFQELIWMAAGWSPYEGHLVTTDMGNISRIQLAQNMLNRRMVKEERLRDETRVVIDYFNQCRAMRNGLVHGVPVYDDNEKLSGRLAQFEAKRGTGQVAIKKIDVTMPFLVEMLADLLTCDDGIRDAIRKIQNLRQYEANEYIRKEFTLEDFVYDYRAPSFDIDGVRSRLKWLRSPPAQNKNPSPPGSSPGSPQPRIRCRRTRPSRQC